MAKYRITGPDGGTYDVTAPDGASESDVLAYAQKNYKPNAAQQVANDEISQDARSFGSQGSDALGGASQVALNALGGLARGAGSIGATILSPMDWLARKAGVRNDSVGRTDRREAMTQALGDMGADTNSLAFNAGKLGAEIAGTAGAGGALAKPLQALAASRYGSGIEPVLNGVSRGLETGGFRIGELAGTSAAIPARVLTGAATGAATAGMVNPEDAGLGAMIGGAMPAGAATVGKAPKPSSEMLDTARRSMDAGYVIPPSMVDPSFRNRMIEGLSGKFETAQMAATKNQQVTDSLVRKALGMADDAPLSQEAMQAVRKQAGQTYQQLKGTGTVTADQAYIKALDDISKNIKSATAAFPKLGPTNMHGKPIDEIGSLVNSLKQPQFDAGGAVDAIAVLRDNADSAFSSGNRALGRANKAAAKALEDVLDRHLQQIGATDLLPAYRDARALIAKTYTAEKGLREGAGHVDARALARELQKGKPLSGDLRAVAEFGNVFNKAAQPPHLIGSPGVSVLKPLLSGGMGAVAGGPAGMAAGVATNYVLPPLTRSVMFSKPYQRGLLDISPGLMDEAVPLGLLTRGALTAPVLSAR